MNLYLVQRTDRIYWGEFDAMVVCARDEEHARELLPSIESVLDNPKEASWRPWQRAVDPASLRVRRVGTAERGLKPGCVLASYLAG